MEVDTVKTAVIGGTGFIGRHLLDSYRSVYPDCVGTSRSGGQELVAFDLGQPELSLLRLQQSGHGAVAIAAANPNIAYCERETAAAYQVNVRGTLELARQIAATPLKLIWFSSDYVFDGHQGGYSEAAPQHPGTEYGKQKAQVEAQLPLLLDNYLILRLSKTYGTNKFDNTLLDEIAATLTAGKSLSAAWDQKFSPTHVSDVIRAVHGLQAKNAVGVYNVCAAEDWSRYEVAVEMARRLHVDESRVSKISLHDLASMSGRPLNTTLRNSKLTTAIKTSFIPLSSCAQIVANHYSVSLATNQKAEPIDAAPRD